MNQELTNVQAEFRKGRGSRDLIVNYRWITEKAKNSIKISTSASLTIPKPLTVWITTNWKILKEMGIPDHPTCLLRNMYADFCTQVRKQQWELDMKQQTGSKQGKEYIKGVYCHPVYLTYMQSTSCKMTGWMKHKLESRLLGEKSTTSDMQMTPPLWQKVKKNYNASW